jgi:hypothetical protein
MVGWAVVRLELSCLLLRIVLEVETQQLIDVNKHATILTYVQDKYFTLASS